MNFSKYQNIVFSMVASILLLFGLFLALRITAVQADAGFLYVSSTDPTCGGLSPCYTNLQDAVDAASDGNAIKIATGVYTGVQTRAGITQVLFLSKSLTIQGGFTTIDWNTSDPDANPVTLDAQGLGRGLVISGPITVTIEGIQITGGDASGWGDGGGGMFILQATTTISNCLIYSNTASTVAAGQGGGIYIYGSNSILIGNTIQDNIASNTDWGKGGGIYSEQSIVTLIGNTVQENLASTAIEGIGGGIYLTHSQATMTGNTLQRNTASTGLVGFGGGMEAFESGVIMIGNLVQGNISRANASNSYGNPLSSEKAAPQCDPVVINAEGGGLSFTGSSVTLNDNRVIDNIANSSTGDPGGGAGGGMSFGSCAANLTGNTSKDNIASTGTGSYSGGEGGGIFVLAGSNFVARGNTIQGNTASPTSTGRGGGLFIFAMTSALNENLVLDNTAGTTECSWGGGLYLWGTTTFTLTNNLVAGNYSQAEASGLWIGGNVDYPTTGILRHTTIADHPSGSGEGIHVGDYATLVFTNTIITGHPTVGITVNAGSTVSMDSTLMFNNLLNISGTGTLITHADHYGNPAFANPSTWDYHLTPGSAAIDAGVNVGVTTDIDGDSRPQGMGYDIGYDEYTAHLYLPIVSRSQVVGRSHRDEPKDNRP